MAHVNAPDHGELSGLSDDDHTQYHNDDRGDARYGRLTGGNSWAGVNEFDGPLYAGIFIPSLLDSTGIGQQFNDNDSSFPTGWTEEDAATTSATNVVGGLWYNLSDSSNTSYAYHKQTGLDVEVDLSSNNFASFYFGPILFRQITYTATLTTTFAIHADDAGSYDPDNCVFCDLQYETTGNTWQIRGSSTEGGVTSNGSWVTLTGEPLPSEFWVRLVVRNGANMKVAYGNSKYGAAHLQIYGTTGAVTWGDVHARISQTRSTGGQAYLYVGQMDLDNTG